MSGIQTLKYKRKKITVIFWNNKVWFKLKEICEIIKCSKKDETHMLSFIITDYMPDEDKQLDTRPKLVSASGLQYLVERVNNEASAERKIERFLRLDRKRSYACFYRIHQKLAIILTLFETV